MEEKTTRENLNKFALSVLVNRTYEYEGYNIPMIRCDNDIVYVNLTEVSKAFPNKNLTQIVNSQEINEYCESLSKLQNYSLADLLIVKRGGNDNGTWAHQKVALRVAQKLSPDFAVMVDTWIEKLLTEGKVEVRPHELSRKELALMVIQAEEEKERLMLENKAQADKIAEDAPKVVFAEAIETSDSVCLVGELAKILKQNGIKNIGQNRLYKWLRSHSYLGNKGDNYNLPTQKAMELGVFKVIKGKRIDRYTGGVIVTRTAKVTTKGLKYFINKFRNIAAAM